jgi:hypothetical protein
MDSEWPSDDTRICKVMWLLVFITYWDGQIMTVGNGIFKTHLECFAEREKLSSEVGGMSGYFPPNMQAVCMRIELPKDPT